MKKSFLLVVLFAASAAQTQNLKMISVRFPANGSIPNTIQFLCSQNYDHADCVKDATALRQAMAPCPTQMLGAWSFVLVTADEWKSLVRSQGGDSVSPAFSMLDQRVTLLDASLFSGSATRNKELIQRFSLMGPQLVDLAVTHEMGHGICQEKDERRADDYGKDLRNGNIPDCSKPPGGKQSSLATNVPAAGSTSPR